jgi:hypothetical protein
LQKMTGYSRQSVDAPLPSSRATAKRPTLGHGWRPPGLGRFAEANAKHLPGLAMTEGAPRDFAFIGRQLYFSLEWNRRRSADQAADIDQGDETNAA